MNIVSVSFSYSEQSMGHRGLLLMDRYINFSDIIKIDLPVCNSNKPDGEVPPEVDALCEKMDKADILVFSVPEAIMLRHLRMLWIGLYVPAVFIPILDRIAHFIISRYMLLRLLPAMLMQATDILK